VVCVLLVSYFERFSLTMPRWLLTSTIRRSKPGKLHHLPGRNPFFRQLSEPEESFRQWIATTAKGRIAKEKQGVRYRFGKLGLLITRVVFDPIYRRLMR